ncbi:MAG: DMT family transporter [Mucinivorans sp.]
MNRLTGALWGMLSGASFGLIPLFTLPLLHSGLDINSVLFYRFAIAAVMLFGILIIRHTKLNITGGQTLRLALLACLYLVSSLFLLLGYRYMAAGVATTIHFLYPVCVVILMAIFFGERISITSLGAVILAIIGVALLSSGDSPSGAISTPGLVIVLISALAYALYIIGIKKMRLGEIGGLKLTFYVLLITAIMFFAKATIFDQGIMTLQGASNYANAILLALIPTIISNFALIRAIKIIGSTTTSILGALEPMTAVVVGVLIFGEPMSAALALGMLLIIGAVTTIVLRPTKSK